MIKYQVAATMIAAFFGLAVTVLAWLLLITIMEMELKNSKFIDKNITETIDWY